MTTKSKADKNSSLEAATASPAVEASAEAPAKIVAKHVVAEPVAVEPAPVERVSAEPVTEIVDIVSAPLAVIEEAVETASESFSASFKLNSSSFTQKSLELWSQNASAFFTFLEQFARVKSVDEAVELQTRFANERLDAFLRQSKELMETARDAASFSTAPLYGAKKAA
jgi:hypothetical protein